MIANQLAAERLKVIEDEISKGRLVTGPAVYDADKNALFSNIGGRQIQFNSIEAAADWFIDLRADEALHAKA